MPWPQGCPLNSRQNPQVTLVNNLFYFDQDRSTGFYVTRGCADACDSDYRNFQSFQGNLYWRVNALGADDGFGIDKYAFHVLTDPPQGTAASSCGADPAPAAFWTFLSFEDWQGKSGPVMLTQGQLVMSEDNMGGVVANPFFASTTPSQPLDFLLTSNPVIGFNYRLTNDTIQNAGRSNPQINPAKVPHTFPTFYRDSF
jgi:hypothetical protein